MSDVTIGDAHHIEELFPELDVAEGVSTILFHSEKGMELKNELDKSMRLYPIEYDWAVEHNQQLKRPTEIHPNTKKFYKIVDKIGFDVAVNKCTKRSLISKVKNRISLMLR